MDQIPMQAVALALMVLIFMFIVLPKLKLSAITLRNFRLIAVWAIFAFLTYDFYIKQKGWGYSLFFLAAAIGYTYMILQAKRKDS